MKLTEKDFEKIKSLKGNLENIEMAIGKLEINKWKMISHALDLSNNLEKLAEDSLIASGVPKENLRDYKIDINTGNITTKKEDNDRVDDNNEG